MPLAHETIIVLDGLHGGLSFAILDPSLPLSIQHSAKRAMKKLNQYYHRTDESDIARFGLSTRFSFRCIAI